MVGAPSSSPPYDFMGAIYIYIYIYIMAGLLDPGGAPSCRAYWHVSKGGSMENRCTKESYRHKTCLLVLSGGRIPFTSYEDHAQYSQRIMCTFRPRVGVGGRHSGRPWWFSEAPVSRTFTPNVSAETIRRRLRAFIPRKSCLTSNIREH